MRSTSTLFLYCRGNRTLLLWGATFFAMVGCCLSATTAIVGGNVTRLQHYNGVAATGTNTSLGTSPIWNHPPKPFDSDAQYSRAIFVSTLGHDTEGDGSFRRPLRTIRRALDSAVPGTRISVLPGVYPGVGTVRGLAGTPEQPIAIVGRGEAIVDGDGESVGLHLSEAHNLVIQGLTFRNTWPHGVNIDDGGTYDSPSHHLILRELHFLNVGEGGNNDCLKLSGVDHFWVLDSEFEQCNQGEAIDMVGCHDGIVEHNNFHDIPRNAVQTKGGSHDILIYANRFSDIEQRAINAGGHTGSSYFRPLNSQHEAARIQMVANVFERIGNTPVAFVGCDACVFANNTVVEGGKFVARILAENRERGPTEGGIFINNILVLTADVSRSQKLIDIDNKTLTHSLKLHNNLWVSPHAEFQLRTGMVPGRDISSIITRDGGFRDLAQGNYRIDADSPAVGRGHLVPRGLPGDFLGRTYSIPPSIGAFRRP